MPFSKIDSSDNTKKLRDFNKLSIRLRLLPQNVKPISNMPICY